MNRLEEMEAFVETARGLSVTRAADRLGVAKSAVSRRLKELEARLGVQLLNRTTRKLSLTEAGEAFYQRACAILDDLVEAEAAASAGQSALSGRLKIAAPLSFGLMHLRPVISEFIAAHPAVEVDIDFSDRPVDLVGEGFDVAVRIGVLADTSLIGRRLCPIRMGVAAAPDFWRRAGTPVSPLDLNDLACLRYANFSRPGVIAYWGPGGEEGTITPRLRCLANNGDFLMDMAEDGHGFVIEPTFFLYERVRSGRLALALTDYAWANPSLYVLYPPTRQLSRRVRAFADAVIERFDKNPYWDDGLTG